jgi:hypothetical protein
MESSDARDFIRVAYNEHAKLVGFEKAVPSDEPELVPRDFGGGPTCPAGRKCGQTVRRKVFVG